jgi:hypothetical protein
MIGRVKLIANNICEKLKSNGFTASNIEEEINYHLEELQEGNLINHPCVHYLLYVTCQYNMLHEMNELLSLSLYHDINQSLYPKEKIQIISSEAMNDILLPKEKKEWMPKKIAGKTLLGLCAYLGQIELVKYLIEVKLADVNARDDAGNTALHQVVYGDSRRNNLASPPNIQNKVAKCLINKGGDISRKNHKKESAYEAALKAAPTIWNTLGFKRQPTHENPLDTFSTTYDADTVRSVFEKEMIAIKTSNAELKKEVVSEKKGLQIISLNKVSSIKTENFSDFRLRNAIKTYIKEDKVAFGFSSLEELYKTLDTFSDEKARQVSEIVSSQGPAPYSFYLGLISSQLPKLAKHSVVVGVGASLLAYYETHSILISLSSGAISACVAFSYLTNKTYKEKCHERALVQQRIEKLQKHDRFFKPISTITSEQIKPFNDGHAELILSKKFN